MALKDLKNCQVKGPGPVCMAGAFSAGLFSAMVSGKNAAILLTEDLNQGQQMEGITIVNPFL